MIQRSGRRSMISAGLGLVLGALVATGGAGVWAQDAATPVDMTTDTATVEMAGRPAHIHEGTCSELGGVVVPLTDLTGPGQDMVGEGNVADAIAAEYSFTTVPLALEDILAADHAINVHESAENIGEFIACGAIGGTVDENGSLVVGLAELNLSGYTGIAVLTSNADDPATTDVSVFIARDLAAETIGGVEVIDFEDLIATPEATPGT